MVEATNGEEGIRIATELGGAIDLVITDVVMPVMGGRELSTRLLAMWPRMKILFTSGYTDDTILAEASMQPGTSFIQKPFTPDSLLPVVRAMLESGCRVALTATPAKRKRVRRYFDRRNRASVCNALDHAAVHVGRADAR